MHHYRCQNVYLSATVSERIVDTLKFSPHNFPMTKLSVTDILIMAANDMSNALKSSHPEVPFTQIGDDTIEARRSRSWTKFSKTNFKKFKLLDFHTHLPRPLKTKTLPKYPTQSQPLPCKNGSKRDHKR
jgi:predicted RNase H-like nuclease